MSDHGYRERSPRPSDNRFTVGREGQTQNPDVSIPPLFPSAVPRSNEPPAPKNQNNVSYRRYVPPQPFTPMPWRSQLPQTVCYGPGHPSSEATQPQLSLTPHYGPRHPRFEETDPTYYGPRHPRYEGINPAYYGPFHPSYERINPAYYGACHPRFEGTQSLFYGPEQTCPPCLRLQTNEEEAQLSHSLQPHFRNPDQAEHLDNNCGNASTHAKTIPPIMKVKDKAPGDCMWEDVCHFMLMAYKGKPTGGSFGEYLDSLEFHSLPICDGNQFPCGPAEDLMFRVPGKFEDAASNTSDARNLHRPIHSILELVVEYLNGYDYSEVKFLASSGPALNEVVYQCISEKECLVRMLLVIHEPETYPYGLRSTHARAQPSLSGMLQQVATSYKSCQWKDKIMCGLVTNTEWNFFEVKPVEVSSITCLEITECYRHNLVFEKSKDLQQLLYSRSRSRKARSFDELVVFLTKCLDE